MPLAALAAAARGASPAAGSARAAAGPDRDPSAAAAGGQAGSADASDQSSRTARSPLLSETSRLEQVFAGALAGRQAGDAAEAILALDRTILEWSADTLQSDEPDRARAVLHSLVHRLGEAASGGLRDPKEALAPLVEQLIALRAQLRAERAWALADRVRDGLIAAGIDLQDTPTGTSWTLRA